MLQQAYECHPKKQPYKVDCGGTCDVLLHTLLFMTHIWTDVEQLIICHKRKEKGLSHQGVHHSCFPQPQTTKNIWSVFNNVFNTQTERFGGTFEMTMQEQCWWLIWVNSGGNECVESPVECQNIIYVLASMCYVCFGINVLCEFCISDNNLIHVLFVTLTLYNYSYSVLCIYWDTKQSSICVCLVQSSMFLRTWDQYPNYWAIHTFSSKLSKYEIFSYWRIPSSLGL